MDRGESLGSVAGVGRPGIVHRLDRDTSGLLVVAKTDAAQASLMAQFGRRAIDKGYLALVRGAAPAARGRIEAPVGRHPRDRQRMAVVAGGRAAMTDYEVLGAGGGYTLLHLEPRTGRTHQLRAHLAYLGLPIAGDLRYGGGLGPADLRRQFLHAAELAFRRPSDGARVEAWSALPEDLATSLATSGISLSDLPSVSGHRVALDAANGGAVA
jgi:23S rRNA pseudouridine1911/1915/1917 synthase